MRIKNSKKKRIKMGSMYVPAVVTAECPNCGNEMTKNFSNDHYDSMP